jgi:hypothetical protein
MRQGQAFSAKRTAVSALYLVNNDIRSATWAYDSNSVRISSATKQNAARDEKTHCGLFKVKLFTGRFSWAFRRRLPK